MLKDKDKPGFIDFITNRFDPDYEYNSKQKEIDSKDFRVEKPKMSDINTRYDEFKSFEQSPSFKNTQMATDLLSPSFDIGASDLIHTLKQKYGLDNNDCNEVMRNLANSKDVSMRVGTFDKVVRMRRK